MLGVLFIVILFSFNISFRRIETALETPRLLFRNKVTVIRHNETPEVKTERSGAVLCVSGRMDPDI